MKTLLNKINIAVKEGRGLEYYELLEMQKLFKDLDYLVKIDFQNKLYTFMQKYKPIIYEVLLQYDTEEIDYKLKTQSLTKSEINDIILYFYRRENE